MSQGVKEGTRPEPALPPLHLGTLLVFAGILHLVVLQEQVRVDATHAKRTGS